MQKWKQKKVKIFYKIWGPHNKSEIKIQHIWSSWTFPGFAACFGLHGEWKYVCVFMLEMQWNTLAQLV